jgi:hypothetical protein
MTYLSFYKVIYHRFDLTKTIIMRKNYFIPFILFLAILGLNNVLSAQKQIHPLTPSEVSALDLGKYPIKNSLTKSTLCQDTLRYSELKEALYGTGTYYWLDLWQSDSEAMSMTFLTTHTTNITGVEFLGRKSTSSASNVVVNCGVYSVNATGEPTNLLGSGTVNISSTTFSRQIVNFSIPITVTGNYAIVIQPSNANGILDLYINDANVNTLYDETLARFKSNYYLSSNGSWITIPTFNEFVPSPANFEPILAPIISYTLNTTAAANPLSSCIGNPINFTQTTTPAGIQGNRFYNWYSLIDHFSTNAVDSTYKWFLGTGAPEIQSIGSSATNTYNATGQYSVKVMNYGGLWSICNDSSIVQITITQPTVNAGNDVVACEGETITLNATGANSYNWTNSIINGQSFIASTVGQSTYQVTGTDVNGCTNTDQINVTVNPITISTLTETAVDSFNFNGLTLTQGGIYFDTLISSFGCDSIIQLNLTLGYSGLMNNINLEFEIFPNPTTGQVSLKGMHNSDIEIFDAQGKLLFKTSESEFNISNFSKGIYFLHLKEENNHVLVKPIIKE